jgi:dTDP-4-amino-4,6-dideoxygalactose transaminase
VDIEEATYNIDPAKVRSAISAKTKAIIPVHLYGQPAKMAEILKLAREFKLKVVEDAAQAHGAKLQLSSGEWKCVGTLGEVGCFSFYPSKNLGGLGDGGMVITDNRDISDKVFCLRNCGRKSKYEHVLLGYNMRLDTLQAALLRVKLKRLKAWNAMRRAAAQIYNRYLGGIKEVIIPSAAAGVEHVYHVYALRVKNRNQLCAELKSYGVDALIHYPIPLHLQQAYAELGYQRGDLPVSERIAQEIVSLPMFPHLKESQIRYIAKIIKKTIKG